MPETIDWPARGKAAPRASCHYLLLAFVILIFIGGRTAISYWVDLLWFRSLGYASVFWKTLASSGEPSRPLRRSPSSILFARSSLCATAMPRFA
jgi:hypothetical protein